MKKLIVIGIVAAMVMGLSVAALATADNWLVYMHVGLNTTANDGADHSKFGIKTTANDLYSANGAGYSASVPEIWFTDGGTHMYPVDTGTDSRWYQATFTKAVGHDPSVAEVDWVMEIKGAASATVYLTAWNGTPVSQDWDGTKFSSLAIYSAPGGVKTGDPLYSFDKTQNGVNTGTGMTGNYFQQSWTLDSTGTKGLILAAWVPEPGSMVAVLSGLIGLVGFGIRRRK
jgi:hypothetical protein